jgi:ADP-heptose:LPS heptosyltransferase
MPPRNVLIFHSGALGDFILSWPLVLGAARVMPQCRTIVITAGEKGKLAERVLRIESSDAESGWQKLFADGNLPAKHAKTLAGARLVLSFVADFGSPWEKYLSRLAPDAEVHHLEARPTREGIGAVDFLLEQLEDEPVVHQATAGMVASIRRNGLLPRAADPTGPIVVHPGSGSAQKNWPAGRWAAWMKQAGRPVRLLLGEVEMEKMPAKEMALLESAAGEVRRPTNLLALLEGLSGASAYVGHDSGPTHLAAIIGLPTLALFGPTDPAVWSPLGPRVRCLRHEPLAELEPEAVSEAFLDLD